MFYEAEKAKLSFSWQIIWKCCLRGRGVDLVQFNFIIKEKSAILWWGQSLWAQSMTVFALCAQMAKLDELDGVKKVTAPCTLDKPTQSLIKLIFDNDMFKEAMANMEIGEHLLS